MSGCPAKSQEEERQSIEDLQKDGTILILSAEKSRATVILDTKAYEDWIDSMLNNDKTYEQLNKDPTRNKTSRHI